MAAYVLRTSSPDVISEDTAWDVTRQRAKIGSVVALKSGDVAKVYAIQRQAVSNGSFWIAGARSCPMDEAIRAGLSEQSPRIKPIRMVKE